MYKIDFKAVGDSEVVTLAKAPLDTAAEALAFAVAKVRKHLGLSRVTVVYYVPPCYRVMLDKDCLGHLSIRKV